MPFKGRDGGTWKDASAVYGRSGGSWLYGKSAWAKKDGTWQRAWTDCRRHDAGGRDWTTSTSCTECTEVTTDYAGCDSCGSRTATRTRTRYTKDGCTTYYSDWSAYSYGSCSGSWSAASPPDPNTSYGLEIDGVTYLWSGTPGYYAIIFSGCRTCPSGCFTNTQYYITQCSVTSAYRVTYLSCDPCTDFSNNPC